MTTARPRAFGQVVLALALLGGAVWVWSLMPNKLQSWAPIVKQGTLGEEVVGRNLRVTVHSAALTNELTFSKFDQVQRVPTKGVWLVMDISYGTIDMFETPSFAVDAAGRHFTSFFGGFAKPVEPGFIKRAPVAFELPERPASAKVFVSNEVSDRYGNPLTAPLDSQIAVTLDLAGIPVSRTIDLDLVGR